jgi:hypothetical protein
MAWMSFGVDALKELNVVVGMKLHQLPHICGSRLEKVHSEMEAIADDKLLGKGKSPRFHRVTLPKMVAFDSGVVMKRDVVPVRSLDAVRIRFGFDEAVLRGI